MVNWPIYGLFFAFCYLVLSFSTGYFLEESFYSKPLFMTTFIHWMIKGPKFQWLNGLVLDSKLHKIIQELNIVPITIKSETQLQLFRRNHSTEFRMTLVHNIYEKVIIGPLKGLFFAFRVLASVWACKWNFVPTVHNYFYLLLTSRLLTVK